MSRGKRLALVFASIPFVLLVGALPWVNRIEPRVAGLPFVLAWILGGVALTPLCLWAAERAIGAEEDADAGADEEPGAGTGRP